MLAVGTYTNEASIEGNEGTGTKTSNKVTAKVAAEPSFTIKKEQRIAGEVAYTASELTGKLGQTVEYKITVKNTGNLPLKFSALKDTGCRGSRPPARPNSPSAKKSPSPAAHARGRHHTNEASIEGNEGTGTKTSNKVTDQSHRRTQLHDREAAADRRRRHIHLGRTHRQTRARPSNTRSSSRTPATCR